MPKTWVTSARRDILTKHQDEYEDSDEQSRADIIRAIKDEMKALGGNRLPKKLRKAISDWYAQEKDRAEEGETRKERKKWTMRKVVIELRKSEIEERIKELLDDNEFHRGDSHYLAVYPKALNQVISGLTDDERTEYTSLAEKWSTESAPRDVQIRQAERHAGSAITKFIEDIDHDMGIKSLVLTAWVGPKNDMRYACTETAGESKFESKYPNLYQKLMKTFTEWAESQFEETRPDDQDNDSDDDEDHISKNSKRRKGTKKALFHLDENDTGHAIIPVFDSCQTRGSLEEIIRAIVTHAYRKYTKNSRASVPWTKLDNKWMEGWENSVQIRDPSHINLSDGTKLYNHWLSRQKQKKSPVFRFVKAVEGDKRRMVDEDFQTKRNKRKRGRNDYEDSDEEEDENGQGENMDVDETGPVEEICNAPADVPDTVEDRLRYLHSLTHLSDFKTLLGCLPRMEHGPGAPDVPGWPEWASWTNQSKWLPASFHSGKKQMLNWCSFMGKKKPYQHWPRHAPTYEEVERLSLMLGLIYYNVWTTIECSKDEELASLDKIPSHVVDGLHKDLGDVISHIHKARVSLEKSLDQPVAGPSKDNIPARQQQKKIKVIHSPSQTRSKTAARKGRSAAGKKGKARA